MNLEIRQALLDWNPWVRGPFPTELLGLKREYDLTPYLAVPEIKIIEGARRVGKSTLLYEVIRQVLNISEKVLYINFEDEILKNYSLSEIVYEHLEYGEIDYLFVDEIQSCSEWVQFIRKVYDRREFKQIWVSGSNASLIKEEYASLLTGRNLPIHIFPLSFKEFLGFKAVTINAAILPKREQAKVIGLFAEYMEYGSFPAVVTRTAFKKEILLSYFEDFIYKDIVVRHRINASKIRELAIYLATNSAKLFSYRKIAAALHCHLDTVLDYFSYLKEAFLFEEVYKYDPSLQKQMSNERKIYCLDTGLAGCVSFRFSDDKGRVLENLIYCELRRRKQEIYYHKHLLECDFVIKAELQITQAIQVCLTLEDPNTRAREFAGLLEAMQAYKLTTGLILTYDEESVETVVNNETTYVLQIIPAWKWLQS